MKKVHLKGTLQAEMQNQEKQQVNISFLILCVFLNLNFC
jgi:hypothetical protein